MPTNKEKDHLAKEPSIGFKRMSADLEALVEDTRLSATAFGKKYAESFERNAPHMTVKEHRAVVEKDGGFYFNEEPTTDEAGLPR
jgi:hypothetical protein